MEEPAQTLRSRVVDQIAAVLEPLQKEIDELKEQRNLKLAELDALTVAKKAEIREINDAIRSVSGVMRSMQYALNPKEKGPGPKGGKNKQTQASRTRSREDTIQKVLAAFKNNPDRTWSNAELERETGLHHTTVTSATNMLRERQEIRLLGRRPKSPGQTGAPIVHFGLMPQNGDIDGDE